RPWDSRCSGSRGALRPFSRRHRGRTLLGAWAGLPSLALVLLLGAAGLAALVAFTADVARAALLAKVSLTAALLAGLVFLRPLLATHVALSRLLRLLLHRLVDLRGSCRLCGGAPNGR